LKHHTGRLRSGFAELSGARSTPTSPCLLGALAGTRAVPWDYSHARLGIDGLVRLDYLPLWAAYGLGLERLHDLLVNPERGKEKELEPPGKGPRPGLV